MELYRIGYTSRIYKVINISDGYMFAGMYGGKYNKITNTITI